MHPPAWHWRRLRGRWRPPRRRWGRPCWTSVTRVLGPLRCPVHDRREASADSAPASGSDGRKASRAWPGLFCLIPPRLPAWAVTGVGADVEDRLLGLDAKHIVLGGTCAGLGVADDSHVGRARGVFRRKQVVEPAGAMVGVFGQRFGHDRSIRLGEHRYIRPGRQVLHQDLVDRLSLERHPAREHLVDDHAHRVNVDRLVILARADLRRHVMTGADALGVLGALTGRDQFGQAVVADLDDPFLHEQVGGLQVAVQQSRDRAGKRRLRPTL